MPIVLKSGSLKLLEPLGPVQACNGIALPLLLLSGLDFLPIRTGIKGFHVYTITNVNNKRAGNHNHHRHVHEGLSVFPVP